MTKFINRNTPFLHQYLSHRDKLYRWIFLGFSLTAFLALWLQNQGHKILIWGNPIKYIFGIPCPFCGMTRAMMMIIRGDYFQALSFHLFSFPIFIGIFLGIVIVIIELTIKRNFLTYFKLSLSHHFIKKITLIAFLGYYILRLYARFGIGGWHDALMDSSFGMTLLSKASFL